MIREMEGILNEKTEQQANEQERIKNAEESRAVDYRNFGRETMADSVGVKEWLFELQRDRPLSPLLF